MLLTNKQVTKCHKLNKLEEDKMKCMEKQLEYVSEQRFVDITISKYFNSKTHIKRVIKKCQATLFS